MRILLIEDNEELCNAVAFHLSKDGYIVDVCHDGDDGLRWICQQAHDLILLDRMLPRMDGLQILNKARAQGINTPVLMITALNEIEDRVSGLDAGADDYLVKPFAIQELLARIRAMNRRPRSWDCSGTIEYGDIHFSPLDKILKGTHKECTLSKRENELFEVFFKNPNQTLPRSILLSRVWGPDAMVEDGNLDNYIHFLRRRLKSVGSKIAITTVRGIGYRIEYIKCAVKNES